MINPAFRFFDLENKTLLITGVTRGIGRAILPGLLEQGLKLILVSRGMDRLKKIQEELGAKGDRIHLVDCDLSRREDVEKAGQQILELNIPVDGILHNAAVDTRQNFDSPNESLWHDLFQINFFSAVTLTRMLLPIVQKSAQGRIIFTGSVMFDLGSSCLTTYASTKGAIVGLTRSLAHELQGTNITVNCIVPGAITVEKEPRTEEGDARIKAWQTVPRRLEPKDLLGITCLLLSQAGGGITAQCITVDGGILHPIASSKTQSNRAKQKTT